MAKYDEHDHEKPKSAIVRFITHPFGIFVLVLLLLFISLFSFFYINGKIKLNAIVAEIKAAGEPLTIDDVKAMRPEIPDAENMALVVLSCGEKISQYADSSVAEDFIDDVPYLGDQRQYISCKPNQRLSAERMDATKRFLTDNAESLAQLAEAAKLPSGQYPIAFDSSGVMLALDNTSIHRATTKSLCSKALFYANMADNDTATITLLDALAMDRIMQTEPAFVAGLVRIACLRHITHAACDSLAVCDFPEAQLHQLQTRLQEIEKDFSPHWMFVTERALNYNIWQNYFKGALGHGASVGFKLMVLDRAETMQLLTDICSAATLPPSQAIREFANIDKRVADLPFYCTLTKMLIPSMSQCTNIWYRTHAHLRTTIVALAAERYRLKYNHWPERLDDLVPEFIDALPNDPFTGKPLKYLIDETGVTIYSVAEDLTDDNGDIMPNNSRRRPPDVGFRLYHPDKRNQPPATQPTTQPATKP